MSRIRLWLLAHQDDEVLGLHLHLKSSINYVVYLTDGVRAGANYDSDLRCSEARSAWNRIDKDAKLIFFGTEYTLKDGELIKRFSSFHLHELISMCRNRNVDEIISLQLEGGHQDHDTVSMIAEELSLRMSLDLITFPAYRALHKKYPIYVVMSSTRKLIKVNKQSTIVRLRLAIQALAIMNFYRSQSTTWIGLGPFVIFKYLIGNLSLDKHAALSSAQGIPTKLLYVNRQKDNAIDYHDFRRKLSRW